MEHALEVISWPRRLRSTALLLVLVAVLGAFAALVIGAAIVLGASFLDHAL